MIEKAKTNFYHRGHTGSQRKPAVMLKAKGQELRAGRDLSLRFEATEKLTAPSPFLHLPLLLWDSNCEPG